MSVGLRILIVGGYGVFGGRLVQLLEDDARLTLLVAGRSLASARRFCDSRATAAAKLLPTLFDRKQGDTAQLAALGASVVVDASGPFQAYGHDRYRLIEQCIACGAHYLDLADGSDFVAGIGRYQLAALAAGVFAMSGVSSFPVLTAAVVRRLQAAFNIKTVRSIRGGVAPSPFAGVGINVIRAIASYAGQPIRMTRHGATGIGRPFTESIRFVVAVPGRVPLRSTLFSLVDVPDLRALPELWPEASDVWMGAGPVPVLLHHALTVFAWLVRLHLLPNLSWMAAAMHWVTNNIRWGEHRGGMFIQVGGDTAEGKRIVGEWHLLAEGDDGPLIPCMAAEAIVRNMLAGQVPTPGARTAISDVDLGNYESLFTRRTIYSGFRNGTSNDATCLYEQLLGHAWQQLPAAIKELHSVTSVSRFTGICTAERGGNPLAGLIATLVGFPKAGIDRPISVLMESKGRRERWTRICGGRRFSSVQSAGRKRSKWLVTERFGPVSVDMALVVERQTLRYVVRRWALFGIPMPLCLGPRSTAVESVKDGRFFFDVAISHPFVGLIVRYCGFLTSEVFQTDDAGCRVVGADLER